MGKKNQAKKMRAARPTCGSKSPKTAANKHLDEMVDKLLRLTLHPPHANVQKELEAIKEVHVLLEDIIQQEAHSNEPIVPNSSRSSPELLSDFTKWLKMHGAMFDGASIATFEGYDLGLRAEADVPAGALLIAIPRTLMLTEESALESNLAPLLQKDAILKGMPNVVLAMALLVEKFHENSFWKEYINVLPKDYATVLYFTSNELSELQGSPTLKAALKQIKNICRQYAYFYKVIHNSSEPVCLHLRGKFTFEQYRWAVSTVMTRQNMIPSKDKTNLISALIPLWDFCNHTEGNISTEYNPILDRSECLAVRNFKLGEQLFIFYGERTNADLFIHNGFVYEQNEHDGYGLHLGISKLDPLRDERCSLLEKLAINANATFYLDASQQPIMGKLLAFLRVFNMNKEQLQYWAESEKCVDLECLDCALNTCLEKKTWSFLQARIKLLLSAYKTTLCDDQHMLAHPSACSTRKLLAVKMRASEKRILTHVQEYVEQYTKQ